jgi:hypothetical protein
MMGVDHYLVVDAEGQVTLSASMNQRVHWLAKPEKITVQ